jgi:hypothetical protein
MQCARASLAELKNSAAVYGTRICCGDTDEGGTLTQVRVHGANLRNIQIIDGADNATFSIFQVTEEEFKLIFPRPGQDLEIPEAVFKRLGQKKAAELFAPIWQRPVLKSDVQGLHGTLFYNYFEKRHHLPKSKREIDRAEGQINQAQRDLYRTARSVSAKTRHG